METKWNDEEDDALRGLSMLAKLTYLLVFRRHMNYRTGVAGAECRITYQKICDAVGFVPDPGSTKPRWIPSREEVRAAIRELERVAPATGRTIPLLLDNGSCLHHGYIKKLPLASVDTSVQKGNPTRTPLEPHMTNPAESDTETVQKAQAEQSIHENERRDEPRSGRNAAPAMNPSTSGIRIPEENLEQVEMDRAPQTAKSSRGSRLSILDLPDDWRAFANHTRPDLDPEFCWQKFRDYWVAVPGQKGSKLDWLATWRNFIRSEHSPKVNGHDRESAFDRRSRINAELIEAGRRAFESEMG